MGSEAACLFCLAGLYLSCFANQIQFMPTCCGRPYDAGQVKVSAFSAFSSSSLVQVLVVPS